MSSSWLCALLADDAERQRYGRHAEPVTSSERTTSPAESRCLASPLCDTYETAQPTMLGSRTSSSYRLSAYRDRVVVV